jgi:hypothetical protein
MTEQGKNVSNIAQQYNTPRYKFTYQQMKAKFWNNDAMRYGSNKSEFIVVEPQTGADPTYNPFVGIDKYIYAKDIASLEKEINRAVEDKTYVYNLTRANNLGLLENIPKSDDMGIEDRTFRSAIGDENNPFLTDLSFLGEAYKNAREERLKKAEKEMALAADAKVNRKEYEKGRESKRLTLARAAHASAIASGIGLKTALPESMQDIATIVGELNRLVPRGVTPGVDYNREKIDAWRAFFTSIYADKEAKVFQDLGLDFSKDAFFGPIDKPGPTGIPETKYYTGNRSFTPEKIKALIDRQISIKMGAETSTAFSEGIGERLEFSGGEIYSTSGSTKTRKKEKDIIPKSWKEVRDIALDPNNIFPDADVRYKYFQELKQFYSVAKNKFGGSLLPDDLKKQKIDRLNNLQTFYRDYKDALLNDSLSMDPMDPVAPLDAFNPKTYAESIAILNKDDMKTAYNDAVDKYAPDHQLETGNVYGDLPKSDYLINNIIGRLDRRQKMQAEEAAKADPSSYLANGGVVYASRGTMVNYQPRGTDTVPAMLTPGEFVINRAATQKNLPLLTAINAGNYSAGGITKYLNDGGIVFPNYLAGGGMSSVLSGFNFTGFMNSLVGQITSAITLALSKPNPITEQTARGANGVSIIDSESLNKINEFTNRLKSISETLAGLSIPPQITITGSFEPLQIIINGDSVLNQLTPDLQGIVMQQIGDAFEKLKNANQIAGAPLVNPFKV